MLTWGSVLGPGGQSPGASPKPGRAAPCCGTGTRCPRSPRAAVSRSGDASLVPPGLQDAGGRACGAGLGQARTHPLLSVSSETRRVKEGGWDILPGSPRSLRRAALPQRGDRRQPAPTAARPPRGLACPWDGDGAGAGAAACGGPWQASGRGAKPRAKPGANSAAGAAQRAGSCDGGRKEGGGRADGGGGAGSRRSGAGLYRGSEAASPHRGWEPPSSPGAAAPTPALGSGGARQDPQPRGGRGGPFRGLKPAPGRRPLSPQPAPSRGRRAAPPRPAPAGAPAPSPSSPPSSPSAALRLRSPPWAD